MRFSFPNTGRSLSARLLATVWVTLIGCFLSITVLISAILYLTSIHQIRMEYGGAVQFIAATSAVPITTGNHSGINTSIATFVRNPNIASVTVSAADGQIISAYESADKRSSARTLRISRPVRADDGTVLGKVTVEVSLTNFHRRLASAFGLIALLILIPAAAALFIIRRRITELVTIPLRQFLNTAKSLSMGNPYRKIDIPYDNEIGVLAQEFNRIMDDLRRKQNQKVTSEKLETIGALAGGIAHDFNNILGGIIGNVSLLRYKIRSGSMSEDEIEGYLHTVETISQKAVSLSKQLLSLSNPREITSPVNLGTIIGNVTEICRKTLDRRIEVTTRALPDDAMTTGDPAQIEQALLNVCINAAHSMTIMRPAGEPQGGKLVLGLYGPVFTTGDTLQFSCSSETPYWAITVSDEGVGMDESEISRVYDPFFTTKNDQGSGLGMTMVYSIINRHSGFVAIESQKGKGTSVTLHLPEHKIVKEAAKKPRKKGFVPKEHRVVLLVDDEDYIRKMARSILEFGGYTSLEATDGDEAVTAFIERQSEVSLVILDLMMPKKSGLETYREIMSINPSAKVLFTSGLRKNEGDSLLELPENAAFLAKPYTAEQLLRIVDRLITTERRSVL